jgi:hypothetical protein
MDAKSDAEDNGDVKIAGLRSRMLKWCSEEPAAFRLLWKRLIPDHYREPVEIRARHLLEWPSDNPWHIRHPSSVCLLLREGETVLRPEDVYTLEAANFPLLNLISRLFDNNKFKHTWPGDIWLNFLIDFASSSKELSGAIQEINCNGQLCAFLELVLPTEDRKRRNIHRNDFERHLREICYRKQRLLRDWLRGLREAGIDLREYGVRQQQLFRQAESKGLVRSVNSTEIRLTGFTCGPTSDDWSLQWEYGCKVRPAASHFDFAREFWHAVENPRPVEPPPKYVPGGWMRVFDDG